MFTLNIAINVTSQFRQPTTRMLFQDTYDSNECDEEETIKESIREKVSSFLLLKDNVSSSEKTNQGNLSDVYDEYDEYDDEYDEYDDDDYNSSPYEDEDENASEDPTDDNKDNLVELVDNRTGL